MCSRAATGAQTQGRGAGRSRGLAARLWRRASADRAQVGVPVIVGEDRYAAGRFAEEKFGPRLHLLDDGFQHRRLARDFDIVLVTATDAQDSLAAGGQAARAAVVAGARRRDCADQRHAGGRTAARAASRCGECSATSSLPESRDPAWPSAASRGRRAFFAQLRAAGVTLAGTRSFRDHHRYTDCRCAPACWQLRKQRGAAAFVTTEKDAINLEHILAALQPIARRSGDECSCTMPAAVAGRSSWRRLRSESRQPA